MNRNVKMDKEFILRIIMFGIQATVKSIVARNIKVGFFNFLTVLRFYNHNGMKLHYVLESDKDMEDIVNAIDSELGIRFTIVGNEVDVISVDNIHTPMINWNSSVTLISKQIIFYIEHSKSTPPGPE